MPKPKKTADAKSAKPMPPKNAPAMPPMAGKGGKKGGGKKGC